MRALLVYPEFPDTFWSFRHALKFVRKRASMPPLGLLTVAAMLPQDWSLRLIDLNVRKLTAHDLAEADLVLISAMLAQRPATERLIQQCRAAGKTIVAGGPLFTADPEAFTDVDHLVLDEAELSLPPFLREFAQGTAKRVYRAEGFADITTTPVPRWDLVELGRYASMCVQYSRGCPYDCEFCNVVTLFGRRPRVKSPQQMIAELDAMARVGWRRGIFFVDDNLIGNRRHVRDELLPALTDWRRRYPGRVLSSEASINLADDPALMRAMVAAGFDTVFVGIETPDEASLGECSKKQNRGRDLIADVQRIQRAGLQVQGGFIVGFDNDSSSIFDRQIEFIQRSGIVTAMVGMLSALPGTRLHERMRREGRLVGEASGDQLDGQVNFTPRMDLHELVAGHRRILKVIYAPGPYAQRVRRFLREFRPATQRLKYDRSELHAFASSAWRLGILDRGRFHYWGLLAFAALRRPTAFALTVRLAIYGYHFRKVAETLGA
jgi:radical SAM superfamily enzyme YgiQ (UPF0313 family)